MKKKILALLLSAAIAGNLVACGNAASASSNSGGSNATENAAAQEESQEETEDSGEESGTAEIIGGSLEDETTTVKAGEKEESAVIDVVKVATTDNPADLSPWAGSNSGAVGWLYLFYESLFIEEYKGEMEPCLAKSYTQDGNVITVELFDYIKDMAGNDFTAGDVVFSLDKAIEGGNISYTKILDSYRAVDDYTVELTLKDNLTVGDLETFFTNVYYVTEAAYNASADGMVTDPVGTGHYSVTEYTNGYNLIVEARDDWWQTDEEYIASRSVANAERIEIYVMSDATSAAIAVETGEVDIAGISSTDLPTVEATEGLSVYTFMMVTEAAKQASLRFGKARIGWGSGKCNVNVNRDVKTPFGWWNGQNPDGPSNKTMTVLRVEDPEGRPKGFFISYGIKPCAIDNAGMETDTRKISADVCGVCSRIMEEKFHVPAVFCVSAAADQVPKEQAWWEEADGEGRSVVRDLGAETGLAIAEKLGGMMGQNAVSIAESVECTENTAKLCHSAVSFMWKTKSGRPTGPGAPVKEYPEEGECRVEAEIMTLGDTAFIAEKPEINCRTELELQEQSPYVRTLIICMVNGNMKYMPDRSAYERNTFEAQSSMLQPGAAERFVKETVSELNRMAKR